MNRKIASKPNAPRDRAAAPATVETSFATVVRLIEAARQRAYQSVSTELGTLYLASDIQTNLRGFTRANLFRMRQFFEVYRTEEKVAPLVRQLPWSHNLIILGRCKRSEAVEYGLSRSLSPALVAEYQTTLPDKKVRQSKLHEFYELTESSAARAAAPAPPSKTIKGKRRRVADDPWS